MDTMDDAGVYRITRDIALVQTVDFLFPIVNNPRDFGKVAAANSLSDVWAMGAKAHTAMNILAYPAGKIPVEMIEELLIGGSEKLTEAGVALVGGHTLEQETFIYGMSVTGTVHPKRVKTNATARAGDLIILTKPIGTGIMSSACSEDGLTDQQYKVFVDSMSRLNKYASEILLNYDISALTDVTGFGLLGHAFPIAKNAQVSLHIDSSKVPLFDDIFDLMKKYNPKGTGKTIEYIDEHTCFHTDRDSLRIKLLSEPQTSGGLLVMIKASQAKKALAALHKAGDTTAVIIGEVKPLRSAKDTCLLNIY